MAINVGSAEITVDADTRPFLTGLQKTMALAARSTARSASKMGKGIGDGISDNMIKSLNKGGDAFAKVFSGKIGMIAAALPLATSGISALAGAATALSGSIIRASIQAASFVGVMGAMAQVAIVAMIAFKGMGKAIGGDEEAMKTLAPAAQNVVKSFRSLGGEWKALKQSVQQQVFAGLADDVRQIGGTLLPVLQAKLSGTGRQLNLLFQDISKFVQSKQFVAQFGNALGANNRIFATLRKAAVPLLNGLLNLFRALQPSAHNLAGGIVRAAQAFSRWAEAGRKSGSIKGYMDAAAKSFHQVWRVVRNLGTALWNISQIGADSGDSLMKKFGDLMGTFKRFTQSAEGQSSIATWIDQGVSAVTKLASILGTLAPVFSALFDPALINMFLGVIQQLTPTISTIAGVIQSALAPVIENIGTALAENGPKIAALFVALAPLLKGLGAVLGEIISQTLNMIGTIAAVITPVVALISNIIGPILTKFAPIIAFVILLFAAWEPKVAEVLAAFVKFIPVIGRFLSPLMKVGSFLTNILGKAFEVVGANLMVFGVLFRGVGSVLAKIGSAIMKMAGPVKMLGTFFMVAIHAIVDAAKWLWNTLFGGSIFPDIIKAMGVFVGLFKGYIMMWVAVFKFVINIVKVVASAIGTAFRAISSVVMTVVRFIVSGLTSGFNSMKNAVMNAMKNILNVIRQVWIAIKGAFSAAVNGIKTVIKNNFQFYKMIITKVWNAVRESTTKVWNTIKGAVSKAVNAVKSVVSSVFNSVKGVVSNAWNAVKTATQNAWDGIKNAVVNKINSLMTAVNGIKGKVTSALSGFGTLLYQTGKDLISGLINGVGAMAGALTSKVSDIAHGALDKIKSVFGIGSPSKETKKYGAWIVDGLVEGISQGSAKATDVIQALWKKMKKAHEKGALAVIKHQRNAIKVASEALKANGDALAHWATELDTYTQAWQSTYDSMVETFSKTTAFDGGLSTVEDITAQLNDTVAQTERMQAAMNALAAKGLDPKLIEQLASAGLSGLSSAEALAGASGQQIADMNAAQAKLNTMAAGIGTTTANALYKAKKDEAQVWVKQLQDAMPGLKKNMKDLADHFVESINKAIDKTKGGYTSEAQAAKDEKKDKKKKHPHKAAGDWDFSGGMTWVGEKGPELINVPKHTQIMNDKMLGQAAGGGTTVVNVAMTVSVDDLAKMGQVSDFLNMLNLSRMNSRKTARSGTVTA